MRTREYHFLLDDQGIAGYLALQRQIIDESFPQIPNREMIETANKSILQNLQNHYGPEKEVTFIIKERFRRVSFAYKIAGDEYDPRLIAQAGSEQDPFTTEFLRKYSGATMAFHYKNGVNTIQAVQKKKKPLNSILKIVIGLVLGLLLSLVGMAFSQPLRDNLTIILDTVNSISLNLIVMSATLVVFFMVINSVSGFGSIETVKKSGACLIKNYMLHYLLATILIFLYIFLAFDFTLSTGSGETGLVSTLAETIAGIFPASYVTPFVECSFLQIIFIAAVVGIAILVIGDRVKIVSDFFNTAEILANQIMEWFCGLIPLYIFSMVPSLIWGRELADAAGMLIHLAGMIVLMIICFTMAFLWMCYKRKISPGKAFKLVSPALLQGLVTASSTSTLGKIQDGIRGFGVKESFNGFATAAGMIFVSMACYIGLFITTFTLIIAAGIEVSVSTLLSLTISALLFSIATPPVGGGVLAIAIVLATMFGIPDSYMAILAPVMLIEDFIATGFRCGNIVIHSVLGAVQLDEIEEKQGIVTAHDHTISCGQ